MPVNGSALYLWKTFRFPNKKRGLIGSFFNRIVEGNNGDFVITFSDEGNYRFMNVSRSTSHGSLLDLCEGASSETEPVRSNWTTVMEDILEDVVRSCQ